MKSLIRNLFLPLAGLALAVTAATAAPWPPAPGDVILGVQATGGTGATTNVFFNLGPAHTLRDDPNPAGTLVNLDTELTAAFGAGWSSRTDLYFGVIANRSNATPSGLGSVAPENGDPARTIYASKGVTVAGTGTPWSGFSVSALGLAATAHQGQLAAIDNISANGNNVMTLIQASNPVEWNNSWSQWNPTPGTAYSIFNGGLQAQINATAALVDVFRIVSTSGSGSYVTTISLAANGDVTAARAGGGNTTYFTVTATATNGSVSGAGTIVYPQGSVAKLTASPNTGFGFVGWSGDASGSTNPINVTMDANKNVTATFAPLPSVTSPTATGITETSATLGGNVTSDGGQTVTERGVVYAPLATNSNPVLGGTGVVSQTAAGTTGVFTTDVTGLTAGTTYAYKAYATTPAGTGYTSVALFTTDTAVTFNGGVGIVSDRTIQAGDTQVFTFNLANPADVAFTSNGATGISWEIRDSGNNLVDSGTGPLDFSGVLLDGDYRLSITGGGSAETFSLNLDASTEAAPKADVAVGAALTSLTGSDVYSPTPQLHGAVSTKAKPVTRYFAVDNDGPVADTFSVQASPGNGLFKVSYFQDGNNVTAQVVAGTFSTVSIAEADNPVGFKMSVVPNKKKLVKTKKTKKGKKTKYLKKSFSSVITATADSDPSSTDSATIRVQTK